MQIKKQYEIEKRLTHILTRCFSIPKLLLRFLGANFVRFLYMNSYAAEMWFSDFPMKLRVLINESGVQSGGLNTQVFLNTRTSLKIPGCEFCLFLYMNCYAAEMCFSDFPMKPRVLINESGVQSGGLNTRVFWIPELLPRFLGANFVRFCIWNAMLRKVGFRIFWWSLGYSSTRVGLGKPGLGLA